jgi:polyhydroxybutyrate depolymerase
MILFALLALTATDTIDVGGIQREYALYVPPDAKPRAPALVVLHGRSGSARQVRRHSGFDDEARRLGFVVVYPQGIDHKWTDLRQVTLDPQQRTLGADDVGFLIALTDHLAAQGTIDAARVYYVGHSNGGFLAITMACTHAERVAGIGIVAANLPKADCKLARPVPSIFFHGTKDPLVPYEGGSVARGQRGFIRSAEETVAVFADRAKCKAPVKRALVDKEDDGTQLVVVDREDCVVPTVHFIAEEGGHGWPGRPPRMLKATKEIDATRAMVAFFFEGLRP